MLILNWQVELQVIINCFLVIHKTFLVVEGRKKILVYLQLD